MNIQCVSWLHVYLSCIIAEEPAVAETSSSEEETETETETDTQQKKPAVTLATSSDEASTTPRSDTTTPRGQ